MNNKLNIIGLAYRAKKTVISLEKIFEFVKHKKIYIVFASGLSESSNESLIKLSKEYNFPICTEFNSAELSQSVGLKNVKAIGLIDKGFYELINK